MRYLIRGLAAAAILCTASAASAGVYSDDLGKCLVAKTSDADKILLMQWTFASMSAHPAVAALGSVTPAQRRDYSHKAGAIMGRLLATDCRAEALAALRYEGMSSLETSFSILGQIAMKNLMSDPGVVKELEALGEGFDRPKLEALMREAGFLAAGNGPSQPQPAAGTGTPPPHP